jgi:hypothetical protein
MSFGSFNGGFLGAIVFALILAFIFMIGQIFFVVEPEVTGIVCEICNAAFTKREELEEHRREKHLSTPDSQLQRQV